jgi:hypothetical protein
MEIECFFGFEVRCSENVEKGGEGGAVRRCQPLEVGAGVNVQNEGKMTSGYTRV